MGGSHRLHPAAHGAVCPPSRTRAGSAEAAAAGFPRPFNDLSPVHAVSARFKSCQIVSKIPKSCLRVSLRFTPFHAVSGPCPRAGRAPAGASCVGEWFCAFGARQADTIPWPASRRIRISGLRRRSAKNGGSRPALRNARHRRAG